MTFTLEAPARPRHRRRVSQMIFRAATLFALGLVLIPAIWIVLGIVLRAIPHFSFSVLTHTSAHGGLENAIVGSFIIMVGVAIIAGTIGLGAGIYLAEMSATSQRGQRVDGLLRTATEVLAGVPSIVLGFVGYIALVVGLHWGYSLLPALIILSMMVVPYIAKATENSLAQVPTAYREGAEALGMAPGYALRHVILKTALPGITTGLLVALAIAGGETAPLLYTAGWNDQMPTLALTGHQVPYLTYPVWAFYNQPSNSLRYLSYDAALILIVFIVTLLVVSRIIVARTQRHADIRR